MSQTVQMLVDEDGSLRFLWDDSLQPMLELGQANLQRASNVEPNADGQWIADMAPIGGPKLGPYKLRGEALADEHAAVMDFLTAGLV